MIWSSSLENALIYGGGVVSPGVPVDHLLFGGGDALIESIESLSTSMVTTAIAVAIVDVIAAAVETASVRA
jgi:hypothetical protein